MIYGFNKEKTYSVDISANPHFVTLLIDIIPRLLYNALTLLQICVKILVEILKEERKCVKV